jgi:hypothetical protein
MQRLQLTYPLSCGMSLLGTKELLIPQFQVSASGRLLPFNADSPQHTTMLQCMRRETAISGHSSIAGEWLLESETGHLSTLDRGSVRE